MDKDQQQQSVASVGSVVSTSSIIPVSITRELTDKLVEKRKGAALELERYYTDYKYKEVSNCHSTIFNCTW